MGISTADYPEGTLYLKEEIFVPKSDVPQQDWQRSIKASLHRMAITENLLLKDVHFSPIPNQPGSFQYQCEFYPARYTSVLSRVANPVKYGHHFVFDYLHPKGDLHFVDRAGIVGAKGQWLLRAYYLQLVQSPPTQSYDTIVASVVSAVTEKNGAPLGRVIALSETHNHIAPPHLNKHAEPVGGITGLYLNPNSKTYMYGERFLKELGQREYAKEFFASLKNMGKKFTSITYRSLPAVGVAVSVDTVARSEDKVNTAIHEATLFSGGITGAGLGALSGSWAGPGGVLFGALLGGYAGSEGADKAYQLTQKTSVSSDASLAFSEQEPHIPMGIPVDISVEDTLTNAIPAISPETSTPIIASPLQDKVNYFALNRLAQRYYPGNKAGRLDISTALQDQWYTTSNSDKPLEILYNQFQALDYLINKHSYFMTSQGREMLVEAQQQLKTQIDNYQPKNPAEAVQYYELKDKFAERPHVSQDLTTDKQQQANQMHPAAQDAIKKSKTPKALHKALSAIPREELTQDPANLPVLLYLDNHWETFELPPEEVERITKLQSSVETALMIENYGKVSIELGRFSVALGNPSLAKILTIGGSVLSGISSAMMFSLSSGAAAVGYAAGGIGAVATIATILLSQPNERSAEATQAILHYLDVLQKQLNAIQTFLVEFRPELYERLNIYFGAVQSQIFYLTEVVRNGHQITSYQWNQLRSMITAILSHLQDTIIYEAKDYSDGIIDIDQAERAALEPLLSHLWLLLDESMADYGSGRGLCVNAAKHSAHVAKADITAILQRNTLDHGQLYGYLACYYQLQQWKNATDYYPIVNHIQWNSLIELYIVLRYAPSLVTHYDANYERIDALHQHGEKQIDFIKDTQHNARDWVNHLLTVIINGTTEATTAFTYSENAKKLVQRHALPQQAQRILDSMKHMGEIPISDMYKSMVQAGLGYFEIQEGRCPERKSHNTPTSHIHFRFNADNHQHILAITWAHTHSGGDIVLWCRLHPGKNPPGIEQQKQEIKARFLAARRQFSSDRVEALKKTLPQFREKTIDALLHIEAILIAAGYPQQLINRLPKLEFPDELSPWIQSYQNDIHHDDAYRALPEATDLIKVFNSYLQNITAYQQEILTFNTTQLANLDIATTALSLVQLNQLKSHLLYAVERTARPVNTTQSKTPYVPPQGFILVPENEWSKLTQKVDLLTQQNEEGKQQFQQILGLLQTLLQQQAPANTVNTVNTVNNGQGTVLSGIAQANTLMTEPFWSCTLYTHSADIALCHNVENRQHMRLTYKSTDLPWNQTNGFAPDCQRLTTGTHCTGEDIEFFEFTVPTTETTETNVPGILQLAMNALFVGFVTSFLLEGINDSLTLLLKGSKHLEPMVKSTMSLFWLVCLLYLTERWYEAVLSMVVTEITRNACDRLGVNKEWSNTIATTVGLSATRSEVSNAKSAVTLVAQLIGSRAGKWAEGRCVAALRISYEENSLMRVASNKI